MTPTLAFARRAAAALLLVQAALAWAQAPAPARPASSAPASTLPATPAAPALPDEGTAVRALVVAEMEATISSQFPGKLVRVSKQVGDSFAAGELLVAFDCGERQARVRTAQAELLGAQETHLAKLKLQSLGAISDLDVTLAAAAAEKAKAQLAAAQVEEKYCTVHAPYPGKVVRVRAKAHESVKQGDALLEIVNPASLRAQLFVPSNWVRWIKPGKTFRVAIDETGQTYNARVTKISGRIDGASQTVEVLAAFDRIPANLLPGMIGKASFPEAR